MFKFLHTADLHLDSQLRGLDRYEGAPVDEIRGATRRALENLIELAIREDVRFVIIAGDVYDGDWQDFNTGLFFVKQMNRLREAGIAAVLISGNHDAANRMTKSLEMPKNVYVLSTTEPETVTGREIGCGLEELEVAFHGQGFRTAAVDENVVLKYPPAKPGAFNIGVLHTSLDMEAGGEHARYAPCSISDLLAKHYDYWALGHVHRRRIVQEDPPIVFPGNTQGRHIREPGAKGCMLVTVDDRGKAAAQFEPLDVFRWHLLTVPVDGLTDEDEVLDRVEGAIRDFLAHHDEMPTGMRVVVSGACSAHRRMAGSPIHWMNQVRAIGLNAGSGNLWIEKVKLQTTPDTPTAGVMMDEGPLREIAAYFDELREREELLAALGEELAALSRKLPDELLSADVDGEPLRLNDPGYLRQALDEVEPLLLTRLRSREGGR
jgi:DNA repair exonuclease SbcCD nuclease subunit